MFSSRSGCKPLEDMEHREYVMNCESFLYQLLFSSGEGLGHSGTVWCTKKDGIVVNIGPCMVFPQPLENSDGLELSQLIECGRTKIKRRTVGLCHCGSCSLWHCEKSGWQGPDDDTVSAVTVKSPKGRRNRKTCRNTAVRNIPRLQ